MLKLIGWLMYFTPAIVILTMFYKDILFLMSSEGKVKPKQKTVAFWFVMLLLTIAVPLWYLLASWFLFR